MKLDFLICVKDYSKVPQIGVVDSYKPKLWYDSEKLFYREALLSYGD